MESMDLTVLLELLEMYSCSLLLHPVAAVALSGSGSHGAGRGKGGDPLKDGADGLPGILQHIRATTWGRSSRARGELDHLRLRYQLELRGLGWGEGYGGHADAGDGQGPQRRWGDSIQGVGGNDRCI